MTDGFWLALFVGLPGIIGALTAAYIAIKQNVIAKQMDGMKDALVKVTGEAEKAKGKLEGADEERANPTGPKSV